MKVLAVLGALVAVVSLPGESVSQSVSAILAAPGGPG